MSHTITSQKRKPSASQKAPAAISATPPTPTMEAPNKSVFDQLPDSALLRESQLVRSPKRPNSTAPLPFSAATLWRMVRAGTFPAPVKLSARVTAFRCSAVREWMTIHTAA